MRPILDKLFLPFGAAVICLSAFLVWNALFGFGTLVWTLRLSLPSMLGFGLVFWGGWIAGQTHTLAGLAASLFLAGCGIPLVFATFVMGQ